MPDYATFGEMLLIGLSEANKFLEETHSEMRFKESTELGEDVYCIFSARKKNGKPKEGEPGKCHRATYNQLLFKRMVYPVVSDLIPLGPFLSILKMCFCCILASKPHFEYNILFCLSKYVLLT